MSITKNKLSNLFQAHDNDHIDKDAPILKETKGASIAIIGKKRTGKTSLILSMLSHRKLYGGHFGNIFLITPSSGDGKMKELIDELDSQGKYFKDLNEQNISKILDFIKNEQAQKKMKENKLKKKLPEIYNLLILDDVISDIGKSFKSKICKLFLNQRHFNLSTILVSQAYPLIPLGIRKNFDIMHIFPMSNLKEKEAIQNDFNIPDKVFNILDDHEHEHPFLTVNVVGAKPKFFLKLDPINI
jgi:hypothetical protein